MFVTRSQWDGLRKRVEQCKIEINVFVSAAMALFGIAFTAFVAAISLADGGSSVSTEQVAWFAGSAVSLVGGVLSLVFSWLRKKDQKGMVTIVLEDMTAIEQGSLTFDPTQVMATGAGNPPKSQV
jgi:hypothetical protein